LSGLVALIALAGCSVLGLDTKTTLDCGNVPARTALEMGGFDAEAVTIVDGCHEVVRDPWQGSETWEVVAAISCREVDLLLEEAGLNPVAGSPRGDMAKDGGLVELESVRITPVGQVPAEGDRLSLNGAIDVGGVSWFRWISWGADVDEAGSCLVRLLLED
jgi:hypothetical protein